MRQSHPLLSTVVGCCVVVCLGVDAATAATGCSSAALTQPNRSVPEDPPPGREDQPTTRPSRPSGTSTQPSAPAAIASRHQPFVDGKCRSCHVGDTTAELRPDFMVACRECHETLFNYHRFGHSPTVVGTCGFCHAMHESENEALLKSQERDLCAACHTAWQKEQARPGYHQGIEAVACTACHDPHFADSYMLLRPENVRRKVRPAPAGRASNSPDGPPERGQPSGSRSPAALLGMIVGVPTQSDPPSAIHNVQRRKDCLSADCHATLAKPAYLHGPIAVNECASCHEETDAENHQYRMTAEPPELCFACHAKLKARLQDTSIRPNHHPPVDDGLCLECHNPHASDLPMMLREDSVVELCLGCHEDDVPLDDPAHAPIEEDANGCIACHRGHDSEHPTLLRRPGGDLCLGCHEQTRVAISSLAHVHPPVRDKECGACHRPHESPHGNLLVERFASETYLPAGEGAGYALCFECHDIELFEDARTQEYTAFRNGEQNLHYLHVNKPSKGRSCRTCHLPHATGQPRLIRSELAFGEWELGIGFLPTDSGGYCGPSCHSAKGYDRAAAVDMNREPVAPGTGKN